ncbi:type II secretion system protein [Malaciobacter canalis]|uniref:type II secretion system protein n=1 Tax=Malaciobacter canalis TaxID=1912871 RepID=UPI00384C376D
MKRAFSLLELIFVITTLALLISFFTYKYEYILSFVNFKEYKFQIAQIRSAIKEKSAIKSLNNFEKLDSLDNSAINKENSKLFTKILDEEIISSKDSWMKIDENIYALKLKGEKIKFQYINTQFKCLNNSKICKELE